MDQYRTIRGGCQGVGLLSGYDTSKGSFLRDPQPVDAVYLELYDLQPAVVEADKIVGVIVPK